ncbi:hypothetical protein AtDm6_3288 [Acetobacter tropicalis]|uniref:Uncharacterized protein n=1 Tax=Acetobacter tropicalis TaxID=104102 RepID=A0A095AVX4_9PROT|nr:hypothetical protein AtDm6_3288 [Acetobacter tropicalis]
MRLNVLAFCPGVSHRAFKIRPFSPQALSLPPVAGVSDGF